jgi:hypothetical protein
MINQPSPWPAPPPSAPTAPSRGRTALAAVVGFALAAVIALVLALTGALPGKSGSDTSAAALQLPATFAGRVPLSMTPQAHQQADLAKNLAANDQYYVAHTTAALRQAYSGAAAAVSIYYKGPDLARFEVRAVRAHTPPPVDVYSDAKAEGLAAPTHQVARLGEVYCEVRTQVISAGSPVPPDDVYVQFCQRTSSSLTIWIYPGGTDESDHHPAAVAALVDQMWDEVA